MKKKRSKLPFIFLTIVAVALVGGIVLGFLSLKPATSTVEQSVTLPLS